MNNLSANTPNLTHSPNNLSDKNLYKLCKKWGAEALHARRKFAGLLPEVFKRRLFERRGFSSIYEFAAKLAGMSRDQVDLVLRLERNFTNKPVLREALIEGKISANKLVRIAAIATTKNQSSLFEAASKLSKQAIDVFVKEYNSASEAEGLRQLSVDDVQQDDVQKNIETERAGPTNCNANIQNHNDSRKPPNEPKTLPGQTFGGQNPAHNFNENNTEKSTSKNSFAKNSDFEIIAAMSPELKQKIKELLDKGLDINKILLGLLKEREQQITKEKAEIAVDNVIERKEKSIIGMPTSRHIPARTIRIIRKEYGSICARENCTNIAHNIHHEQHFAKFHSHDPHYLKPLCRGHHELAHFQGSP